MELEETNWNKIRIKNRLKQEMMKRKRGIFDNDRLDMEKFKETGVQVASQR